jgi:hypothetical protein
MLTFDSQGEHDVFMSFIRTNGTVPFNVMGDKLNIYLSTLAFNKQHTVNDFFWYRTGEPVYKTVNLDWYPGDPSNGVNEFCTVIMQSSGKYGLNDYPCNLLHVQKLFNNTVVCQYKFNSTSGGFNQKYL